MRKLILIGMLFLVGCANSTGWRFEIGISPVKSLSNTAGLKQEVKDDRRY